MHAYTVVFYGGFANFAVKIDYCPRQSVWWKLWKFDSGVRIGPAIKLPTSDLGVGTTRRICHFAQSAGEK